MKFNININRNAKMKYSIISAFFDLQMECVIWNELLERTADIVRILNSHINVTVNERVEVFNKFNYHLIFSFILRFSKKFLIERLNKVEVEAEIPVRRFYLIHGCMLTVVEQLDVEFYKLLEESDVHSLKYAKLLEDETRICQIIDCLQSNVFRPSCADVTCGKWNICTTESTQTTPDCVR